MRGREGARRRGSFTGRAYYCLPLPRRAPAARAAQLSRDLAVRPAMWRRLVFPGQGERDCVWAASGGLRVGCCTCPIQIARLSSCTCSVGSVLLYLPRPARARPVSIRCGCRGSPHWSYTQAPSYFSRVPAPPALCACRSCAGVPSRRVSLPSGPAHFPCKPVCSTACGACHASPPQSQCHPWGHLPLHGAPAGPASARAHSCASASSSRDVAAAVVASARIGVTLRLDLSSRRWSRSSSAGRSSVEDA